MAAVLVFDVNETLLDVGALDPLFADRLGTAELRPPWFTSAVETVVDAMRRLPPRPDVPPLLTRLLDVGVRLTAWTGSMLDVAEAQLSDAGPSDRFEAVFSADEVRALKPALAPYHIVAARCGVDIGDPCLIAAPTRDVSGAMAAGAQAALVARGDVVPSSRGARPAIRAADLTDVGDALPARHGDGRR